MSILLKHLSVFSLVLSLLLTQSVLADEQANETKGTVLITGANRGIGLALVKKFQSEGYSIIATARKPEKAGELKNLGVQIEQLDVTLPDSVSGLKSRLSGTAIDILINNAGIGGHGARTFVEIDIEKLKRVLDVNSLGALRVTQALVPNLEKGKIKIVANMSSVNGSIGLMTSACCLGYNASKSALNSYNKTLSLEFGKKGYIFVVLHPGWVRTDMTPPHATYSVEESSRGLYKVISGLTASDNGKFYDLHGKELEW